MIDINSKIMIAAISSVIVAAVLSYLVCVGLVALDIYLINLGLGTSYHYNNAWIFGLGVFIVWFFWKK